MFSLFGPAFRPIRLRAALKTLRQKTGPYILPNNKKIFVLENIDLPRKQMLM